MDLGIGGYGDDDAVRAALVPIARRRAHRKLGVAFPRHSTLLIGDTPEDVIAARDGGARVIAVASGKSSLIDLKQAGPDIVLRDLTDSAALLDAIQELLPRPRKPHGLRSTGCEPTAGGSRLEAEHYVSPDRETWRTPSRCARRGSTPGWAQRSPITGGNEKCWSALAPTSAP